MAAFRSRNPKPRASTTGLATFRRNPSLTLGARVGLVLLCFTALTSTADTLVLKDGRKITGDIVQIGGRYLVKSPSGSQTFSADEVASWEKSAPAAAASISGAAPGHARPAVKAANPAEINAKAARLVEQGNAALLAGDAQAALENFRDARDLWERQHMRIDVAEPSMFAALHGIGIAYLALGRYEKANDPLDRAYPSPLRGRSLTLNRAILDLVQKVSIAHGIKELKDFIAREPAPDELALNILGAALGQVSNDERLYQGQFIQGVVQFYEQKGKELEAAHANGEKRWGTEWMDLLEAKRHTNAQAADYAKYLAAVEAVRSATAAVTAAQSERDGATSSGAVNVANARLATAKDNLAARTAAQKSAWQNITRPQWPKTFAPVLPESLGGGQFGIPNSAPPESKPAPKLEPTVVAVVPQPPKDPTLVPIVPGPKPKPESEPRETAPAPTATPTATPPVVKAGPRTVSRYAVAVPVGPDLLITAAAPLESSTALRLETSASNTFDAELVRKDASVGLALLRVKGQQLPFLNLASAAFAGGDAVCWGFPDVNVFNPAPDSIVAHTTPPKGDGKWIISMTRHPRLAGAAILDKAGNLVGIALGDRDTVATQIPAVPLDVLRTFLGTDVPKMVSANPDPSLIMQLTASREVQ
jgi:tetratricopeptide (TPR) repeat protein